MCVCVCVCVCGVLVRFQSYIYKVTACCMRRDSARVYVLLHVTLTYRAADTIHECTHRPVTLSWHRANQSWLYPHNSEHLSRKQPLSFFDCEISAQFTGSTQRINKHDMYVLTYINAKKKRIKFPLKLYHISLTNDFKQSCIWVKDWRHCSTVLKLYWMIWQISRFICTCLILLIMPGTSMSLLMSRLNFPG